MYIQGSKLKIAFPWQLAHHTYAAVEKKKVGFFGFLGNKKLTYVLFICVT